MVYQDNNLDPYKTKSPTLPVLYHQVIAESLSEEEIAGLREMFKAMDTDNSGAITFDELKAGLRRYGSTLKDTEIRDLMDAVRQLSPNIFGFFCYIFGMCLLFLLSYLFW